ncbi:MAG: hypothetical protein AAGA68_18790 [Pseudomonadota bacterium]
MKQANSLVAALPLALCSLLLSHQAAAQLSLGGALTYGEGIEELGLQARAAYAFSPSLALAGKYSFFFVDDGVDFSMVDVDLHYTFLADGNVAFYGLGGINLSIFDFDDFFVGFGSETEIGLNVGSGVTVGLNDQIDFVGELKYVIGDADQLVVSAGLRVGF